MRSKTTTCRALVLNREFFGEADAYVELLTQPFGVITTLAKSARKSRKRYTGGLDIFCHNEVLLRGDPRERPYLVELSVLNAFIGIRETLERALAAGKLIQWVRKVCPAGTPMPTVYSLLGQFLTLIEREPVPERLEVLGLVFKLKLLSQIGLRPTVNTCSRCAGPVSHPYAFDLEAGGIACPTCCTNIPSHLRLMLPEQQMNYLQVAEQIRLSDLSKMGFPDHDTESLSRILTRFASYHTHLWLPN